MKVNARMPGKGLSPVDVGVRVESESTDGYG